MQFLSFGFMRIMVVYIIILLAIAGCGKNECISRSAAQSELAGRWQQEDANEPGWYERTTFDIGFAADSFKRVLTEWSDVGGGPCPNSRHNEFITGTFRLQDQTIRLSGIYTEADYSPKISGCYNTGTYEKEFSIYKECELLMLDGIYGHEVISMVKTN